MRTILRPLSSMVVGFVLAVLAPSSGPLALRHAHSGATVTEVPVSLPLSFEANRGQVDSQVHYLARGPGYTVFLTAREAVLALNPGVARRRRLISEAGSERSRPDPGAVVRIQPVGGGKYANGYALDQLPGTSNYFIGSDPANWRTGIPTYGKVKYEGIYPGVDLIYYGNQRQLEFDFVVAPGSDPSMIGLAFQGIDDLEVDPQGALVLKVGGREVRMEKPSVYQVTEAGRWTIPGQYALKDNNQVGFMLASYDTTKPLVIDPALSFSTYLGGNNADSGNGIAVDSSGDAYVTGQTQSSNFPPVNPLAGSGYNSSPDAFVTKLHFNEATTTLSVVYSTYLGGDSVDMGNGIAVDSSGDAYVTGQTQSPNFPTMDPLMGSGYGSPSDAFVTRLHFDEATTTLSVVYSTYLGGDNVDMGNGIAVDSSGDAYVTGQTQSPNFPTVNPLADSGYNSSPDAFVTKLHFDVPRNTLSLVYSTYLGGDNVDKGNGIAVGSSGDAYVTGQTQSSNFPTANAVAGSGFGSPSDAFVSKITGSATPSGGTSVSNSGGGGGCFIATASASEPRK